MYEIFLPTLKRKEQNELIKQVMTMTCKKCLVSGRVQGVFYRETTRRQAEAAGLSGHAFNLPDGRVEVLLCGREQQVERLSHWLWQGSSFCSVTEVQCTDIESPAPVGFITA